MHQRPKVLSSRSMLRLVSEPPASRRLAAMDDPIFALVIQKRDPADRALGFSTQEQRRWLELIRDQIAASVEITAEAFDYAPLAQHGGLGKAYQVFGEALEPLLEELNEVLAA